MKTLYKSKLFTLIVLLLCVFIFDACAVRTQIKKVSIEEVKSNLKYKNIIFRNFTSSPEIKRPELYLIDCMNTSIDYLKMKNIFKLVDKENNQTLTDPTLSVDVNLTDIRIVSAAARMWGGAFAGRSHMKVVAKLTDANGAVVAEQELFGAPNAMGSAYSMGNSDRSLAENMGVLIGDFILANVSAN